MKIVRIKNIITLVFMVFTMALMGQGKTISKAKMYKLMLPDYFPLDKANFTRLSSAYGYRMHPIHKKIKKHKGLDLVAKKGSSVYASAWGKVLESGFDKGYGNYIIVLHNRHTKTLYAHLLKSKVKKGQIVAKGQIIGLVGDTGRVTGPHLHYEIQIKGKRVNPLLFWKKITS